MLLIAACLGTGIASAAPLSLEFGRPLQLYGTEANWDASLRFHNAPPINTALLTTLPLATAPTATAYLDLTGHLGHFGPGELVSFIFKSGREGSNFPDGARFYGQSLMLNYQKTVVAPDPALPDTVPEPKSLILLALGLGAMALRLRRQPPR
jgi:hypothetical protein